MRRILVTQRVEPADESRDYRRDALDQVWIDFLRDCGLLPIVLPNDAETASGILAGLRIDGLLLTGGNSLASLGGDAPERDVAERAALQHALAERLPVLGVCRGMQFLMDHFGVEQVPVEGHVQAVQEIEIEGVPTKVNSYHCWGTHETCEELHVWARAADGVIKAVRHRELPLVGIMWHPERMDPFRAVDVQLFRDVFEGRVRAGRDG